MASWVELLPGELAWMEASLVRLSIIRVALMRFCYEIRNDYLPNNHFASQAVNLVFCDVERGWVTRDLHLQWTCRASFSREIFNEIQPPVSD